MATEFYLNAATGRPDTPAYDRWFRWFKVGVNTVTAILGIGIEVFGNGEPVGHGEAAGLFLFLILVRIVEVIADTIPLVRRRKDLTIPQEGYVNVLWFTLCCKRHEGAEKVDKWLKYASSVGVSLLLCISSFYICAILASIGTALLGFLTAADVLIGGYVVIIDELVKDRRRVRTKPYQIDLDDALALSDEDTLAKDMFSRPSMQAPSAYMQPSPQVLHDVKVEGQWNRVRQEGQPAAAAAAEPFRR